MMMAAGTADPFRDRFAVEPIGDDGVLIDLTTGSFFHLNPTAAKVCLALQESASTEEAAARLAVTMAVPIEAASSLLRQVMSQMNEPGVRTETRGPFRYRLHEGGYALEDRGRTVLSMDQGGRALRLHARPETLAFKMLDYVRAVTPKLLHLRGVTVLHASACVLADGLTAFAGQSGAGKTTTARAFAHAGATLISEDLLVLADAAPITALVHGESRAHAWAAAAADAFSGGFAGEYDCGGLAEVSGPGPALPLVAVWFVDRSRRRGSAVHTRDVHPIDGTLALLANNFLGSEGPESWRRHVRQTHAIARQIGLCELTAPDGVDRLDAAARAYATNTAS